MCGARFTDLHVLQSHMRKHDPRRRHSCPACGNRYMTRRMLRVHVGRCHAARRATRPRPALPNGKTPVPVRKLSIRRKTLGGARHKQQHVTSNNNNNSSSGSGNDCSSVVLAARKKEEEAALRHLRRTAGRLCQPPDEGCPSQGLAKSRDAVVVGRTELLLDNAAANRYTMFHSKDMITDIGREDRRKDVVADNDVWFRMELMRERARGARKKAERATSLLPVVLLPVIKVKAEEEEEEAEQPVQEPMLWLGEGFSDVMVKKEFNTWRHGACKS